ncbi:MAG: site-specific DNA-methyltransferase [Caldilineaceae bacterium]
MSTTTPAAPNFERLKAKMRELFELDKADLDFGIYRILRERHAEITTFLDQHLEQTVRAALQSHGGLQLAQIEENLHKAEAAARAAGFDPATSPIVKELRAQYTAGADLDAIADEVYSHLYTFFARYYQEGDFLGLPRSTVQGREKYMIPYNGEEVKLVWANMDQYYIKSSELLRDYTFRIRRAELNGQQLSLLQGDDEPAEVVIHFKLVEGDTEKDNRKPDGKTTRVFALDADQPFVESDATTLTLRFCYREQATEPNLQRKLNDLTEKRLADDLPAKWQGLLLANDPTYQGKDNRDTRTILQKHLRGYTARHQFDYFIHKDLGGFLRRELDFYIKNEVMHLDDIEGLAAPKAEAYLSKIRALRRCALPVIRMVAQLEEFQKKLWLKKKFVVETRYCLTLDRVPAELYDAICANDAQWAEWEQLYALSAIEPTLLSAPLRTPAFLHQQPHLMLDTRHFDRAFTLRLLAAIDNLDETLDGVCFHSENFQALQLMQEKYREQVKCIYIDPPYNTNASEIFYKNGFKSSSWLSLIEGSFNQIKALATENAIICVTIDDFENHRMRILLDTYLGADRRLGTVCIRNNPQGRSTLVGVRITHEYAYLYALGEMINEVGRLERNEKQKSRYNERDEQGEAFLWENFRKTGTDSEKRDRPKQHYPLFVSHVGIRVPELTWITEGQTWQLDESPHETEEVVWPIDDSGVGKVWKWGIESVKKNLNWLKVEKDRNAKYQIFCRNYLDTDGRLPGTWWDDAKYAAGSHGTNLLDKLFGGERGFLFPKSIFAVEDSLRISNSDNDSTSLDFFAGSGTTGHAVINLNREDGGSRKYLLVEMGEYFDTVLVPRLKKVVYATDWRDGKPQRRDTGLSHAFKIIRLESYEDTLNNLHLRRTPAQEATLRQATDEQRAEYLLGYFLDVESAGSASLLNIACFRDPFQYQMQIATTSAGETKATAIDLVETFNWLLGLQVKQIDSQRGFLTVTGVQRAGGRTLVIWRTLTADPTADPAADNLALERYLARLAINPADTEYDFIYVNGSHTLHDPHKKIHLIEETFHRRMFADQGVGL